jgi:hypothetical protein
MFACFIAELCEDSFAVLFDHFGDLFASVSAARNRPIIFGPGRLFQGA